MLAGRRPPCHGLRGATAHPVPTTARPGARNQVNPNGGAFTLAGPNGSLTSGDFPLHQLADVTNRGSQVTADTNDVVGSQGVVASHFAGITPGDPQDMR